MTALSKRQKDLYEFIDKYIRAEGIAPTLREMANGLSITVGPVQSLLYFMQRKGYVDWVEGSARSVRLLIKTHETVEISLEAAAIADSLIEPGEGRTEVVQRAICLYQQFCELDPVAGDGEPDDGYACCDGGRYPSHQAEADDLHRIFMGMDDDDHPEKLADVIGEDPVLTGRAVVEGVE